MKSCSQNADSSHVHFTQLSSLILSRVIIVLSILAFLGLFVLASGLPCIPPSVIPCFLMGEFIYHPYLSCWLVEVSISFCHLNLFLVFRDVFSCLWLDCQSFLQSPFFLISIFFLSNPPAQTLPPPPFLLIQSHNLISHFLLMLKFLTNIFKLGQE